MEANNDTAIHFELLAERRDQEAAQDKLDAHRCWKLRTLARQLPQYKWEKICRQIKEFGFNEIVDALDVRWEETYANCPHCGACHDTEGESQPICCHYCRKSFTAEDCRKHAENGGAK